MTDTAILVNCRDRVSALRDLVAWLERAGHQRIVLIDNDSTFEPLLDYLNQTPHEVVRLRRNAGSRAIWNAGLTPHDDYIYTDPDCVPIEDCPLDAVDYLHELLRKFPQFPKAGLGLYLDDVPQGMRELEWERSLVAPHREIAPGVFDSLVDTTFALYRAGVPYCLAGIRTGYPYQCRHVSQSWYGGPLTAEDRHYLGRARSGPLGSSWAEMAA